MIIKLIICARFICWITLHHFKVSNADFFFIFTHLNMAKCASRHVKLQYKIYIIIYISTFLLLPTAEKSSTYEFVRMSPEVTEREVLELYLNTKSFAEGCL